MLTQFLIKTMHGDWNYRVVRTSKRETGRHSLRETLWQEIPLFDSQHVWPISCMFISKLTSFYTVQLVILCFKPHLLLQFCANFIRTTNITDKFHVSPLFFWINLVQSLNLSWRIGDEDKRMKHNKPMLLQENSNCWLIILDPRHVHAFSHHNNIASSLALV